MVPAFCRRFSCCYGFVSLSSPVSVGRETSGQRQAKDAAQPVCSCCRAHPNDYVRHGTIDLYAALNLTSGMVIHQLTARHRTIEFKKLLDAIDKAVPAGLEVHVVLDNSSTHKTPAIHRWLLRHLSGTRLMIHSLCEQ